MRTGDLNFGLFLVSTLLLAGCATVVVPLDPQLVGERFPFIRDGKTSKQEVLGRLGEPYSCYEGEQILTYVMCEDISRDGRRFPGYTLITDKEGEAFPGKAGCSSERTNNLILVFDRTISLRDIAWCSSISLSDLAWNSGDDPNEVHTI